MSAASSDSQVRITSRTKARRRALDIVFEADQRGIALGEPLRALLVARTELSPTEAPLPDYAKELVGYLSDHHQRVAATLTQLSVKWPPARMVALDRCLLLLGISELWLTEGKIDSVVVIDEWVKLANYLSTDSSPDFVNGLLAAAAAALPGEQPQANTPDLPDQA